MNISTNTGTDKRILISMEITQSDIAPKVDAAIKKIRRTANIPGFRKGHAPEGMIRKQYGVSIKVDEINNLIRQELDNYIRENADSILLTPMPLPQESLDFDAESFSVTFETIEKPKVDIELSNIQVDKINIEIPDDNVDDLVEKYRKQYGETLSLIEVEAPEAEFISVDVNLPNDDNLYGQESVKISDFVDVERIKAVPVGGQLELKAGDLLKDPSVINKWGLESVTADSDLIMTVKGFYKYPQPEINEDFFNAIFGKDQGVTNVDEMKQRLANDMKMSYHNDIRITLFNDVLDQLLAKNQFDFPEEVLINYLKDGKQDKEVTDDDLASFKKSLSWELVDMELKKAHEIQATLHEVKDYMVARYKMSLGAMGNDDRFTQILLDMADKDMQDQKKLNEARFNIEAEKLTDVFLLNVNQTERTMTPETFKSYVENKNEPAIVE
jgi:trigger factor